MRDVFITKDKLSFSRVLNKSQSLKSNTMKKRFIHLFALLGIVLGVVSSCTTLHHTMREPNVRVELERDDFTLSEQVSATASSTKILGIDFMRLFTKKTGAIEGGGLANISLASVPVIGNLVTDRTANYALYELMKNNPGYDVVFYPQYATKIKRPVLGLGFIYKKTTVQTTARLGKLK
jgi:hypothetical protein